MPPDVACADPLRLWLDNVQPGPRRATCRARLPTDRPPADSRPLRRRMTSCPADCTVTFARGRCAFQVNRSSEMLALGGRRKRTAARARGRCHHPGSTRRHRTRRLHAAPRIQTSHSLFARGQSCVRRSSAGISKPSRRQPGTRNLAHAPRGTLRRAHLCHEHTRADVRGRPTLLLPSHGRPGARERVGVYLPALEDAQLAIQQAAALRRRSRCRILAGRQPVPVHRTSR